MPHSRSLRSSSRRKEEESVAEDVDGPRISERDTMEPWNGRKEEEGDAVAGLPPPDEQRAWVATWSMSFTSSVSEATLRDVDSASAITRTTRQTPQSSRSRSKSPIKNLSDPRLLEKKIGQVTLDRGADECPQEIRQLWDDVDDIERSKRIVPLEFKDRPEIRAARPEEWWYATGSSTLPPDRLVDELRTMKQILKSTIKFKKSNPSEAAWNCDVHSVMLRQVIQHLPGIDQHNVTTYRPNPRLVPKTGNNINNIITESKLVDFTLTCDEELVPQEFIERVLAGSTNHHIDSINHTTAAATAIRTQPIAISFEMRTPDGSQSQVRTQLSLWAATYFNRLRTLLHLQPQHFRQPADKIVVRMPLPLIMMVGGQYTLLFAVDNKDEIHIIDGLLPFGTTESIQGCYKVLAGLRAVGDWVREVWVPWYVEECLGNVRCVE